MKSHISNESAAQIVAVLQDYLSSITRQPYSISAACDDNLTLVWFNSNSTAPFLIHAKSFNQPIRHETPEQQLQAVVYIVVVLMFYSVTIATAMIKYMYQESQQAIEDQMYQDFLTKTKQLALQQAKMEFARRVSVQLVAMSQAFHGRQSVVSRRSTLPPVAEVDTCNDEHNEEPTVIGIDGGDDDDGRYDCNTFSVPSVNCKNNVQAASCYQVYPSGLCRVTDRRSQSSSLAQSAISMEPVTRLSAV